jgi:hypothetical protein
MCCDYSADIWYGESEVSVVLSGSGERTIAYHCDQAGGLSFHSNLCIFVSVFI